MREYLTIKKAADMIGVTPQTLRNWEGEGILVPYRNPVNNYRVYKIEQVKSFIEEMKESRGRRGKFKLRVKSLK